MKPVEFKGTKRELDRTFTLIEIFSRDLARENYIAAAATLHIIHKVSPSIADAVYATLNEEQRKEILSYD